MHSTACSCDGADIDQVGNPLTVKPLKWGTNPAWNEENMRQPQSTVTVTARCPTVSGKRVMLKSKLNNGRISYHPRDIKILFRGFEVPELIKAFLLENYSSVSETEVRILQGNNGELIVPRLVDEGLQLAANETLRLSTRLRHGKVSFEEDDLYFISPDWEIPQYIIERLERDYWAVPCCELYLIIDAEGNLTVRIQMELTDRVASAIFNQVNKVWTIKRN